MMRKSLRGASGTVKRRDKNSVMRSNHVLSKVCKRHEKTNLHIWFDIKEKQEVEKRQTFEIRNEEAGLSVVRTAIKTMKQGGGSIDFQADLDLLALTPGIVYAVKNNSRAMFFDIRDSTFEVVSGKMRKFFCDNIKSIAVTLDKVTVHHTSYTVIMTYFFWRGKLHVVLNELTILNLDNYDSEGTARMVVNSLISTFSYSRTQLANTLRHVSYDGVYASPEERVAGGGCLSLVDNVTDVLGLAKGDITGIWDTGHNLQVGLYYCIILYCIVLLYIVLYYFLFYIV